MPALTYYWRGSTAASINSLSWDTLTNWRVLTLPAGSSLAGLTPATRLPTGFDTVYFGRPYTTQTSGVPAPGIASAVLSPCLFGGVSASTGLWAGSTAGGITLEKYGLVQVSVNPSYPFSKLGGRIDEQILDEWAANIATLFAGTSGANTSPFVLLSGTDGVNGVYSSPSWFGASFGVTAADQPSFAINHRGSWWDQSKFGTRTQIVGYTANGPIPGGATNGTYDGSYNTVNIYSASIPALGTYPNVRESTGAFGFSYATPTDAGDVYRHGAIEVSGIYNSIASPACARDLDLSLKTARVNSITLKPTNAWLVGATLQTVSPSRSWFDLARFSLEQDSSARVVQIGNLDRLLPDASVTIHGDITPTGGFTAAYIAGLSAAGGQVYPAGSFEWTPPITSAQPVEVIVGYPSAVGKQGTVITNTFAQAGVTTNTQTTYSVQGNFSGTNFYLNSGKLQFSSILPTRANIAVTNLFIYGDSEFDVTPASPQFEGTATVGIFPQSNGAIIRPGSGNLFAMTNLVGLSGG